ncbi:MAG TPA: hypothetical protein DDW42_08385 [Desulfobacteraceae bacterium]|nr:hypothetical protein [Desulfobacteraceae bacterium]
MVFTEGKNMVDVNIFGFLRRYMDKQGLAYSLKKEISSGGTPAIDIARQVLVPPEEIEAVFRNGRVINIYDSVFPGDRVSFFPYGTPGPYRVFLGMAREDVERTRREKEK